MNSVVTAFRFLTVVPLGKGDDPGPKGIAASMAWFPLVGFVIGLLLALINWLLRSHMPQQVIDVLIIGALALVTGGLHLDGFADTVDGITGGRGDRARILDIMKDSRVGAMGVVGLVLLLLLKFAALGNVQWHIRTGALIAMPVAARWTQVLMAFGAEYARKEGSLAQPFVEHLELAHFLIATLTAAIAALFFCGLGGLVVTGFIGMFALGAKFYFTRRIGGVTGDTIGAVSEMSEVVFLVGLVMAG